MEFNREKISINRSGRKILQNTSVNKKERFKKHSTVKISWQQRRANELAIRHTSKNNDFLDFICSTIIHNGLRRRLCFYSLM